MIHQVEPNRPVARSVDFLRAACICDFCCCQGLRMPASCRDTQSPIMGGLCSTRIPERYRGGSRSDPVQRSTQIPEASELAFSSVCRLATTRQHRCDGNCEILVVAETFGLTVDVTRDGGER